MRKERILLLLGVWVAVLPYLGFPYSWKDILFVLTGLGIIYLSYSFYTESETKEKKNKTFDNFSENRDFNESEVKN